MICLSHDLNGCFCMISRHDIHKGVAIHCVDVAMHLVHYTCRLCRLSYVCRCVVSLWSCCFLQYCLCVVACYRLTPHVFHVRAHDLTTLLFDILRFGSVAISSTWACCCVGFTTVHVLGHAVVALPRWYPCCRKKAQATAAICCPCMYCIHQTLRI